MVILLAGSSAVLPFLCKPYVQTAAVLVQGLHHKYTQHMGIVTQPDFKLLVMVCHVWLPPQPSSPLTLVPRDESVKLTDETMPSACCGVSGSFYSMGQEEVIQV